MLEDRHGVRTCEDNAMAASRARVVLLATKPQVLPAAAEGLAAVIQRDAPLVISIAAGIGLAQLAEWFGTGVALIRAMPNTPALIGEAATGLCGNSRVSTDDRDLALNLFAAVGVAHWVDDESLMDAITAVSGSGPAYFFYLSEALEAAALQQGLPPEVARSLALQTAYGAAAMARQEPHSAAELRRRVTSPGGTTEAAIGALESGGFKNLVQQAVEAAAKRSKELAG